MRWKVVVAKVVVVVVGNRARFGTQTGQSTSQPLRIAFVGALEEDTPTE